MKAKVTREMVFQAADYLDSIGTSVNAATVRTAMGDIGSLETIQAYLKEWRVLQTTRKSDDMPTIPDEILKSSAKNAEEMWNQIMVIAKNKIDKIKEDADLRINQATTEVKNSWTIRDQMEDQYATENAAKCVALEKIQHLEVEIAKVEARELATFSSCESRLYDLRSELTLARKKNDELLLNLQEIFRQLAVMESRAICAENELNDLQVCIYPGAGKFAK